MVRKQNPASFIATFTHTHPLPEHPALKLCIGTGKVFNNLSLSKVETSHDLAHYVPAPKQMVSSLLLLKINREEMKMFLFFPSKILLSVTKLHLLP